MAVERSPSSHERPTIFGATSPWPDDAEGDLVDRAVDGDRYAFALLYDRHIDRVYRHCYFRVANRADAEDLAQQTFLQAWQAIGRYQRRETPFIAWLLTISQRLTVNHYRVTRPVVDLDAAAHLSSPHSDPAEAVQAGIARDHVRIAILSLSADRQAVIILRYIEGFTVREVAAALGKSENNVHVLQHRALADLRRLLKLPTTSAADQTTLAGRFRGAIRLAFGRRPLLP